MFAQPCRASLHAKRLLVGPGAARRLKFPAEIGDADESRPLAFNLPEQTARLLSAHGVGNRLRIDLEVRRPRERNLNAAIAAASFSLRAHVVLFWERSLISACDSPRVCRYGRGRSSIGADGVRRY